MQLLADTLVELAIIPAILDETVRWTLKNDSQPWRIQKWVIPPASASFVAAMVEILDLYDEPADPTRPRVCVDEMPYQLPADKVAPLPGSRAPPATGPQLLARADVQHFRRVPVRNRLAALYGDGSADDAGFG